MATSSCLAGVLLLGIAATAHAGGGAKLDTAKIEELTGAKG